MTVDVITVGVAMEVEPVEMAARVEELVGAIGVEMVAEMEMELLVHGAHN